MGKAKQRVQAVDIACEILEELQERERAGITELSDSLGYAKSAIHTQLATLKANELVVQDGTEYRLGLRFLDMSSSVRSQIEKYDVIVSEVESLARETDEVVQFATEEHDWLVYLYKAKGETGVETASTIGKREYLHTKSLGKAILAHYPEERIDEIIRNRGLPKMTENTTSTKAELLEELEKTRERGISVDDEESITGLRCVGAPVVTDDGDVLGALSVSGPSRRMTDERIENELKDTISKSANVIQLNYKFS